MVIELLKAVLFGIVEGITEWLPISSTGHLILVQEFINFKGANTAFLEVFNVVIQLGAIFAVMVIYFDRLNPFGSGKTSTDVRQTWQLWIKVIIACLPAVVFGLLLDDWFEAHFYNFFSVAIMLILYGIAFIWVENRHKAYVPKVQDMSRMSYKMALGIGLFQVLSLVPGTSRSGATILGGILLGTSRSVATEFTFFLGIPIMFGASLLKLFKFVSHGNHLTLDQSLILIVAMLVAFVVSMGVIRFLTNFVKKHDFKVFGYYRIILGSLLIVYGLVKLVLN